MNFRPENRYFLILALFLVFFSGASRAQVKKDTTIILITDITVQIEATQALNDLYNFKFEKAEQQFRWFKQKYSWHPLPYFLLGLSEWWKPWRKSIAWAGARECAPR